MCRSKLLSLLMLGVLMLGGCSATQKQVSNTVVNKPTEINASYVSRPINVPSIVAQERKMFETEFSKDSIEFKWHDLTVPSSQLEALASKSLDFANSLNYVSAILTKANGNDIKIVSAYSRFPKGISMVVNANSAVKTIADLKGKKVALQRGTMLHEMLMKALTNASLTEKDIELIDMDSTNSLMAVVSGQIDATILPEPLLSKAVASGKATKLMSAEGLISGLTVVAVRSDFAKEQPDLVKRYLRVQKESIDWGTANLENALKLTATKNQMDLNAVMKLYPEFSFDMSLDDVKVGLISSAVFLKKEKMLKPDVDINKLVDSLVDTSFLPQK